jgi:hypothetical protein
MKQLFDDISQEMSRLTTKRYSTSFSLGISFLHKDLHKPIYSIYGFVRFADEIVDSFHGFDKAQLLAEFKVETYKAIAQLVRKGSLNFGEFARGLNLFPANQVGLKSTLNVLDGIGWFFLFSNWRFFRPVLDWFFFNSRYNFCWHFFCHAFDCFRWFLRSEFANHPS